MPNPKTTTATINERQYEIRRFPPDLGVFIVMKLLGAGIRGSDVANNIPTPPKPAAEAAPEPKQSGADTVRALASAALMGGITFDLVQFIQRNCLALCSRLEGATAIPIATSTGALLPDVSDDLPLVMKLTMEVLVFNFADFFDQGGTRGI